MQLDSSSIYSLHFLVKWIQLHLIRQQSVRYKKDNRQKLDNSYLANSVFVALDPLTFTIAYFSEEGINI
jgi:hypothetical protein